MKKLGIFAGGVITGGVAVVVAEAIWLANKAKVITEESLKAAGEISRVFEDEEKFEQIKNNIKNELKDLDDEAKKKIIEGLNKTIDIANEVKENITDENTNKNDNKEV